MNRIIIDNAPYSYRDGMALRQPEGYDPHVSTRFRNWDDAKRADRLPELYGDRSECCDCTACMAVCPTGSIIMEPDEEGFDYPVVNAATCIGCQKCVRICPFKERLVG